jgi:hypothetical protein
LGTGFPVSAGSIRVWTCCHKPCRATIWPPAGPIAALAARAGLRALKTDASGVEETKVISQTLVILSGLVVAGWGHLLVHDLLGACTVWSRLDGRFPPSMQSTPWFAGRAILIMGAVLVLAPILG